MEIREIIEEIKKLQVECIQKAIEYARKSNYAHDNQTRDEEGDMEDEPENWKWLQKEMTYEIQSSKAYKAEERLIEAKKLLMEIMEEEQ